MTLTIIKAEKSVAGILGTSIHPCVQRVAGFYFGESGNAVEQITGEQPLLVRVAECA